MNNIVEKEAEKLSALVRAPAYQARFAEVLGERGPQFLSSLLSVGNSLGPDVDPKSIIASGMIAAVLDLPVDKSLGFAWIVPYKSNIRQKDGSWTTVRRAQMQIGYKGYIQLGLRSSQYSRLNAIPINREVFSGYDQVGEPVLDFNKLDPAAEAYGYFFGFILTNGFVKRTVWTKEQVESHAQRFSQSYRTNSEIWKENFHEMALKTVIANTLRKWGPLSVQMQTAVKYDQSIVPDLGQDGNLPEPIAAELEDAMDRPQVHPEIARAERERSAPVAERERSAAEAKKEPAKFKNLKETAIPVESVKTAPAPAPSPTPAPAAPTPPEPVSATPQESEDAAVEAEYGPAVQPQAQPAPAPAPAPIDFKAQAAKAKAAIELANRRMAQASAGAASMKDAAKEQAEEAMGITIAPDGSVETKERKPLVQEMEPVATEPENTKVVPMPEPEVLTFTPAQQELRDQLQFENVSFEDFVDWGRATIQMKVDVTKQWAGFSDDNCKFFISKIPHIAAAVKAFKEKRRKK